MNYYYVATYRMVKTLVVKNFDETATVKHQQKKLWQIDAQKIIIKRLITFLVKLRIVMIVIGRLPHVKR